MIIVSVSVVLVAIVRGICIWDVLKTVLAVFTKVPPRIVFRANHLCDVLNVACLPPAQGAEVPEVPVVPGGDGPASLSPSLGMSQQPGPSGFGFSTLPFSSHQMGGPPPLFSPPQGNTQRPPQVHLCVCVCVCVCVCEVPTVSDVFIFCRVCSEYLHHRTF